ncbi:flagellar motor protein MotA [Methylococcaceae bacterium]|jgi:chemotaxis protein MotA|nr:flagellar motor stator protein MotA [Methylococcales bacterium]GDX84594.1 flagellar motor protein MotA [Methylococcaceae bacterium]
MLVIIGYVVVCASLIGGYTGGGGHLGILFQPFEYIIIVGAAVGALVVANPLSLVKEAVAKATATLKPEPYNREFYLDLIMCFYMLTNKTRKEGLLSLEELIENPDSNPTIFTEKIVHDHHLLGFVCDNLRLIVTGIEVHQLEELMDQTMDTHHEDSHKPVGVIQTMADGLPAFGIVAAVMGVVHTMELVGAPPSVMGKAIAAALVGTFVGILLAYGFVGPVGALMATRSEMEANLYKCAQKGLLCTAKGVSPMMTAEYMRAMISSDKRPSFKELDDLLRTSKG